MEIITALIAGGLIGLISAVFNKVFDRVTSKKDKSDQTIKDMAELKQEQKVQAEQIKNITNHIEALSFAELTDLRDRITRLCKKQIAIGSIDPDDYENLVSLHEAYHRCGGNGYLDGLMEKVKNLPMVVEK